MSDKPTFIQLFYTNRADIYSKKFHKLSDT